MTTLRAAAEEVLEALQEIVRSTDSKWQSDRACKSFQILEQVLKDERQDKNEVVEQAQDDPYGWIGEQSRLFIKNVGQLNVKGTRLYTHPQPAQNPQDLPVYTDEVKLDSIEQYQMQMAAISTAAMGFWEVGDDIHPDYDTPALRDVAELYSKYYSLRTNSLTEGYIQLVPDHCDRITWCGSYYHLPLSSNTTQQPLTDEQIKSLLDEVGYEQSSVYERVHFINGLKHGEFVHGIRGNA